jgi:uncharacterized surface protein with fasciclin (FAS1) repeats
MAGFFYSRSNFQLIPDFQQLTTHYQQEACLSMFSADIFSITMQIKQKTIMKKSILKKVITVSAAAVLFLTILSACSKSDNTTMPPASSNTITDIVSANSSFSLLKSAVVKAGLATTLSGTGPFTVFAPSDTAFTGSGITSAVISSLSGSQLSAILLYHTLPAKIMAADVPAGPNAKVVTAGGDSVFVTKNASGVFVNGIPVTQADIAADNGVIHAIARVLLPPASNLVQVAQADTALTYLVAAVLRASTGSTNVADVLSSGGIFTVFAPTNDAFRAAGFPTIASINTADPNTLTSILTYHVLSGRAFSSDLTEGAKPATLNGATVTISLAGGATVKGNSNSSKSNIMATNIMASNGVVHKIDQVLLP